MHLSAFTIFFFRYQTIKSQSLILGLIFLVLGVILYRNEKKLLENNRRPASGQAVDKNDKKRGNE